MFQPTRRRVSEKIKSTLDSDALPFHEILDANMVESTLSSEGVQFKDRIYTDQRQLNFPTATITNPHRPQLIFLVAIPRSEVNLHGDCRGPTRARRTVCRLD
jgi:hypothetical protein